MAVVALMLAMIMVFVVGCAPKTEASAEAPEETATTWTSDAGNVYNLVAVEDIVIGFNNGSRTVDFLRMVGDNTVEVAEREGIKIVVTESNRKPTPAHMSNEGDLELMEKDLSITYEATKKNGCSVELIVRDVYDVGGDMKRLPQWVELAKKTFGI